MDTWNSRQFIDSSARHPVRFSLYDTETGEIKSVCDLIFIPGEIYSAGTNAKCRGHWQPIEGYLHSIYVSNLFESLKGIDAKLDDYAPISGASFYNPAASASPPTTNIGGGLATTAFVRSFVSQYPFPPKSVKNLSASVSGDSFNLKWNDPADFSFDQMSLAVWKGTRVLYRNDRYPQNESDGTIVANSTTRNRYSSTALNIPGGEGTYYFGIYPYTDKGQFNINSANRISSYLPYFKKALPDLTYAPYTSPSRAYMCAATDGNGSVLFGGGLRDASAIVPGTVEVDRYSVDGVKTNLDSMQTPRYSFAAATTGSGSVLFGGGWGNGSPAINSVESYSASGARSTLSPLTNAAGSLAAAADGSGNVLFGGGYGNGSSFATVDLYTRDGAKGTRANLSVARSGLCAATDGNGSVLFGGGGSVVDKYTKDGAKSTLSPLSVSRSGVAAAADGSGNVLFGGGNSAVVDRYSVSGERVTLSPMYTSRTSAAAAIDKQGNVLFFGGGTQYIDRYTPDGARTVINLVMYSGGAGASASTDGNGNIIAAGTAGDTGTSSRVNQYFSNGG